MSNERALFKNIIGTLGDLGVLEHLLLIGSWAEYVYEISYLKEFQANLRTRDVDLLIKNLRHPQEKIDIIKKLEEKGFIYDVNPLTGVTKFFNETLEIEFVARELSSGRVEPYTHRAFGIRVEGLRNMDMLIESQIPLMVENYLVCVPAPHAYVLHKLLIWPNRGSKQEKDMRAIENLLDTIDNYEVEKQGLRKLYSALTPKQIKIINEVCIKNAVKLFDEQF